MTAWTSDELHKIGSADELDIITLRGDGTSRKPVEAAASAATPHCCSPREDARVAVADGGEATPVVADVTRPTDATAMVDTAIKACGRLASADSRLANQA